MRPLTGLACFVLCVMALAPTSMLAQDTKKIVTVYTDDFSGAHYDLEPGRYNHVYLAQSGIPVIGSVRVPAGMKAVLFSEDNFQGESLTLIEDGRTPLLRANGFAQIGLTVSLVVEEYTPPAPSGPVVTIYKDNFKGASKTLAAGEYNFSDLGAVGNDQLSAVKVPKGMKVTLYEHGAFAGRKLVLTKDTDAAFLVAKKFNDLTSSIKVELLPEPAPIKVTETPAPVPQKELPVTTPAEPEAAVVPDKVMVYEGDFSGKSKVLEPGRYGFDKLGIANNELSSVRVPRGFRVTLFDKEAFEGKSLVLTQDTRADFFADRNFNNLTSSLIVEKIPVVTIYQGDYSGDFRNLEAGRYGINDLGIGNDQLSSIRIPRGFRVTLFENESFSGRQLTLTQDAGTDVLTANRFNKVTSSILVEQAEDKPALMATVYQDNFSGASKQLLPGNYEYQQLGIGNNTVSSVRVPRGLKVTLYEYGAFEGRSMQVTKDTPAEFFEASQFNDLTTSVRVEEIPEENLYVTIYSDSYSGASQRLAPGKYDAGEIEIGDDKLSSVRVPAGMSVRLHTDPHFKGSSMTLEHSADLSRNPSMNDKVSSLVVEDITVPVVTPPTKTAEPEPVTAPVVTVTETTGVTESTSCAFTADEYALAYKAVEGKSFRDEKMAMARLVTKDKCLSNVQVRNFAQLFSFEDQKLEFVKYAYDLSTERSSYYTMEDLFAFMSTREDFMNFLKTK